MMTALKALLTGILCLLLLALLAGIVFLASLFLGFELKSLIMPLVALAALVVLFFAGRRAWLYLAGRRFRKTVLATDTRKVASQVVDEANANAMEEACRAGLAHMDAMSLGRNPLVFVLSSPQGNAHGLAGALATDTLQGVASPASMLAWHFSDTLSLIVPEPAHLSLKDGTFRQGFERTLALLKGHNPAEPVSAILVVLSVRELAGIDQDGMGAGMASGLADRELTERARILRARSEDILRAHRARMPLHVVVTGIEEMESVGELLQTLSPLSREVLAGRDFAGDTSPNDCAHAALCACSKTLSGLVLAEACQGRAPRGKMLDASRDIFALESGLALFLRALLLPVVEGKTPFLRSIRFASLGEAHETPQKVREAATPLAALARDISAQPDTQAPKALVPSFVQGLGAVIARDRSLYVSLEEGSAHDRPRALAYGACCLTLLGICALAAHATLHTTQGLNEAKRLWLEAQNNTAPMARLQDEAQAIRFLQGRHSPLPGLGLDTTDNEVTRAGRVFATNFEPIQERVLQECQSLGLGNEAQGFAAMQRVLWLNHVIDARLKGQEPSLPFPLEGESVASGTSLWTPDFGNLFAVHTSLASQTELENLQGRLAALSGLLVGRDAQAIFHRLCALENARAPRGEFPTSRYWPGSPRGSAGFSSVPAIYTPQGYASLHDNLEALSREAGTRLDEQPFWKRYLQDYADVWAQFIKKTDNAWLVTDNVESLVRMSAQSEGKKDPYFRLIADISLQLEPLFAENAAPPWADDLRLVRDMLLVCEARGSQDARSLASVLWDATSLERRDLRILQEEIRERRQVGFLVDGVNAFEAYLAALEELRGTLADQEGSLALAAIDFGGREYGDPAKTAFARARTALGELRKALGLKAQERGSRETSPAFMLVSGPLRFLEQAITYSAASSLQRLWESEVLPQAALLPAEEAVEGLFGEKGLVTAFATQHLAPFVSRSVGAYRARTRGLVTFPFADAFLNFMQEGKSAQANPLRESYSVAIKTSAATINPDAAERLEYYEVSLTCRKGRQSVRNANYPNDAVFEFEPQNCGEGRISFSFPSLKLEYAYSDFRALLEDFSLGERVFSPNDFPEQADRMERLRIHNVRVRLLADDAPKVLSAFTGELVVPTRIVSTW